jgi:hypothetical protein
MIEQIVLAGATVGKVLLSSGGSIRATGVEYKDEKSNVYTVNAAREVLLATGSLKTPGM